MPRGPAPDTGANTSGAAPVLLADGTAVLVVTPWNSTGNAWGGLFRQLRTVVALALAVAVVLAFALSRSLTRRLRALTMGAHVMAGGDYAAAVRLVPAPREGAATKWMSWSPRSGRWRRAWHGRSRPSAIWLRTSHTN